MQRVAYKMKLIKGFEAEYKNRHDALWPELYELLKQTGIQDYSIFLDSETSCLFAYLLIDDKEKLSTLTSKGIMKKWWLYMRDIMETNEDNSPVSVQLEEVFYLL